MATASRPSHSASSFVNFLHSLQTLHLHSSLYILILGLYFILIDAATLSSTAIRSITFVSVTLLILVKPAPYELIFFHWPLHTVYLL